MRAFPGTVIARLELNISRGRVTFGQCSSRRNFSLQSFDELVEKRQFTHSFDPKRDVDDTILKDCLVLGQMAPSSFNLQPFKVLIVKSDESKAALAAAMLGANVKRVRDAPVTLVYAADKGKFAQ